MILNQTAAQVTNQCFPRVSGGDPLKFDGEFIVSEFSPRERG